MLALQDILDAQQRISPYIVRTPLLRIPALDQPLGCQVYLKFEGFQIMGAFKIRGAMNKALTLTREQLDCGLVCSSSSGNHAQAVAYAAQRLGSNALIVMPADVNAVKLAGVAAFGGEAELMDASSSVRQARVIRIICWMTESFRLPMRNFLFMGSRKPLCTRLPKKPASQWEQSTHDIRIKTHCLSVFFRISLKR